MKEIKAIIQPYMLESVLDASDLKAVLTRLHPSRLMTVLRMGCYGRARE